MGRYSDMKSREKDYLISGVVGDFIIKVNIMG
jgi:hypothetical protein